MSYSSQTSKDMYLPTSVLESVVAITSQRDRNLLAKAMVTALQEMLGGTRITMYSILPTEQGEEATLMAESCAHCEDATAHPEAGIAISGRDDFSTVFNLARECIQSSGSGRISSVYPIIDRHKVIGLLEVISELHDEPERNLIHALLKVYSNYFSLLEESETDTLTGLLNRRTFDNNIERIITERSPADEPRIEGGQHGPVRRKYGTELPHWLAVMDIDHFKRINDKFGHLYGDEVLLLLARNMQRIFRHRDKLFRFGGEEFIVVLDRASLRDARRVLERFRDSIEKCHFPQVGKVSISIGFVRLDKVDVTSSILGRADQALYYAKQHGRNQVCFYDDLIAAGKLGVEQFSNDVQLY